MKTYIILGLFLSLLCQRASAEFCGLPSLYRLNDSSEQVGAINLWNGSTLIKFYAYSPTTSDALKQMANTGVGYVCMTCPSPQDATNPPLIKFEECIIDYQSVRCNPKSSFSNYVCSICPDGYYANIPDFTSSGGVDYNNSLHQNTSCSHCGFGYYKSGASCLKCPDHGDTDNFDSDITGCYIWSGTSDETGTFENQKCFYQL